MKTKWRRIQQRFETLFLKFFLQFISSHLSTMEKELLRFSTNIVFILVDNTFWKDGNSFAFFRVDSSYIKCVELNSNAWRLCFFVFTNVPHWNSGLANIQTHRDIHTYTYIERLTTPSYVSMCVIYLTSAR